MTKKTYVASIFILEQIFGEFLPSPEENNAILLEVYILKNHATLLQV